MTMNNPLARRLELSLTVLTLTLIAGCGGGVQETAPITTPATEPAVAQPAEPAPLPYQSDANDANPPTQYYVDGHVVDEAGFDELLATLTVGDVVAGETVENPDGSYGGASETRLATGAAGTFHYTLTVVAENDESQEIRSLDLQ